ncbi:sensor histidine kinase [Metaclostridioides mangenotii]|uniref:sensor histidine kinase n=1 Tax=Metaclostridioides mangenotii TaxID=1540 RepID=UPI0028E8B12F|nr:ATP-binding protein [Clostridioides mangenotii]
MKNKHKFDDIKFKKESSKASVVFRFIAREIKELASNAYQSMLEKFRLSIVLKLNIMYFFRMFSVFITLNLFMAVATGAFVIARTEQSLDKQLYSYSNYITEEKITSNKSVNKDTKKVLGLLNKYDSTNVSIYDNKNKLIYKNSTIKGEKVGKSHKVYKNRYLDIYKDTNNKYNINFLFKRNLSINYKLEETVKVGKNNIQLDMSYDLTEDVWLIGTLILVLFVIEGVITLISLVKVSIKTKKILRPIDDMNRTVKDITINNIDTRLNILGSQNELKDLANTFNSMLDRIQESYETQNQFVSDASHELRTPLTVIQGYARMLSRWGKDDKAVLDESIAAIESESENMKSLIEQLLFLARGDKNTQRFNKDMFKLNDLIDNLVKESNLIDEGRHIIKSDLNEPININADRNLLKEALRVFVDNSIKYTKYGGEITLSSYATDNKATIVIKDTGIGMSKEDLPKIFDRFYRADKSRTRETGGTGLGLAIAKWIITRHGGTIDVTSKIDVGTTFMLKIPLE